MRTLVVLILVALVPLRALAAVTIGFCAAGHHEETVAAHADLGQHPAAHEHHGGKGAPAQPFTPTCSTCAEHCSSAAFAPCGDQTVVISVSPAVRILLAERVAPAFFPDHLDRPPLA